MNDDLFADDYIPLRSRSGRSADQILEDAKASRNREDLWRKNTRKKTPEKPEAKVLKKVKDHLVKVYKAKVIRTNAGSITDAQGHTIYLGETGQSDLHAIIPITIDGYTLGIAAVFEAKADNNERQMRYQKTYLGLIEGKPVGLSDKEKRHLTDQQTYINYVIKRGGIGAFVWSTEDVDRVIMEKTLEITEFIKR